MTPLKGQRFETLEQAQAYLGEQLAAIAKLVENGVIKPVVDKKYPLDAAPEALAYVESGRAAGKVVVEA